MFIIALVSSRAINLAHFLRPNAMQNVTLFVLPEFFLKLKLGMYYIDSYLCSSDLCDHAEEWGRPPHGQFVLLGQLHRRQLHGQVGKQDHVLHCLRLWPGDLRA